MYSFLISNFIYNLPIHNGFTIQANLSKVIKNQSIISFLPFLKKRERKLSKDLLSRKFTFPFPYEKIKDALNLNKTLKHQLVIFFKHLSKRIKSLFSLFSTTDLKYIKLGKPRFNFPFFLPLLLQEFQQEPLQDDQHMRTWT